MLDEANVGRFRDALKELGVDTQFIVITHNRATIESANTVYGISMGDDGVSQVISMRLATEQEPTVVSDHRESLGDSQSSDESQRAEDEGRKADDETADEPVGA